MGTNRAAPTAASDGRDATAPLLDLAGIHRSYGNIRALRGADLRVERPGQVHTLIGENGSGKSTLLGVLSGQLRPDRGTLSIGGSRLDLASPADALAAGIAMVSQEIAVAPALTVAENVMLGRLPRTRRGVDWAAVHRSAQDVLDDLGADYALDRRVGEMRPDEQQMVEIARALAVGARVLVLDEPTSSLSDDEVARLFAAVRRVAGRGVSVVFVSHRLSEVFELSDAITVLRDGQTVATGPAGAFDPESLVAAMVGPSARRSAPATAAPAPTVGTPALEAAALSSPGAFRDVALRIGAGEIVGVAGLVGSGRSELLEALFGVRELHGDVAMGGRAYRPRSERDAIDAGLGFLPPDRKLQGLVLTMSVGENLVLASTSRRSRWGRPDPAERERAFATASDTLRLRAASSRVPVGSLSGGNQQKVAIAKWLAAGARLLLLDEPTRGVDVAAKAEIHDRLRAVAADGVAMLVSSSENSELLELCDRILVLFAGRVVGELVRGEATEADLAALAGGHR